MTYEIAKGIILALALLVMFGAVAQTVVNRAYNALWLGADETDDHVNYRRSGVSVVTDYGTGLQYLVTPKGGITPRMDVSGDQIRTGD